MIYKVNICKCRIKDYNYYKVMYRGHQKLFNIGKLGDEKAYQMAEEYGDFLKKQDTESKDITAKEDIVYKKELTPFDIKKFFAKDVSFTGLLIGSTKAGKTTLLIKIFDKVKDNFDIVIIFSTSIAKDIYKKFKGAILISAFDSDLVDYLKTLNAHLADGKKDMLKILFILDDIVTEKANKMLLQMFCTLRNVNISTLLSIQSPNLVNKNVKNNFNFVSLHRMNDSEAYDEIRKYFFDSDLVEKYIEVPKKVEEKLYRKKAFMRHFMRENVKNYGNLVIDFLNDNELHKNVV